MEHFLPQKRWTTTTGSRSQQEPAWDKKPICKTLPKKIKSTQKLVQAPTKTDHQEEKPMLQHQEELKQPVMLCATKGGPKLLWKGTLEGNQAYINKGMSDVESIYCKWKALTGRIVS
jgi:hypothetical protein